MRPSGSPAADRDRAGGWPHDAGDRRRAARSCRRRSGRRSPPTSPGATSQVDAAHGGDRAVAHAPSPSTGEQIGRCRVHCHARARAEIGAAGPSGSARIAVGRPGGDRPPAVEHVDALAEVHHQAPCCARSPARRNRICDADARRSACRSSSASAGARPAAGSSSSRKRGSSGKRAGETDPPLLAIAEAGGRLMRTSAPAPSRPSIARARRRASRAADAAARRSRPRRSRDRQPLEQRAPPEMCAPRRRGQSRAPGSRVHIALAEATAPACGRWKPERTLTSVVLPAPLGPINPSISPLRKRDATLIDRVEPAEADGHASRCRSSMPNVLRSECADPVRMSGTSPR